jgi:glutamyl-tRNA reductase
VAVDYVKQVFSRFDDKTVLVIGAGKMGRLTLKHLQELAPKRILVTNRSLEKAETIAKECRGTAVPFDQLDEAMVQSNIVLSTTGANEPIMTRSRYEGIRLKRKGGSPVVILDIAVPRDFDPRIGDCDDTFLFNIDDLTKIREETIQQRQSHIRPAELILEQECKKFVEDWKRRKNGPIIQKLTESFDQIREAQLKKLFSQLNGTLSDEDRKFIEWSFRQFQSQFLAGPFEALRESTKDGSSASLLEALRRMFRLSD